MEKDTGATEVFCLKKVISIVLLVSLAIFVATVQVAPALAEHQGHETSDESNEAHQVVFHIDLTGSQQVGPVTTAAFGMATVRLIDNGTAISFRVIVCDIINVTASHIHVGAAGTNGPVIIPFIHGVLFSSPHGCKTLAEGTRTAVDLNTKASPSITSWNDFVKALLAGNTYINVHTTANPGGEIRGQLVHEHEGENADDQGDD
jgi:CHRD domain-containing protein